MSSGGYVNMAGESSRDRIVAGGVDGDPLSNESLAMEQPEESKGTKFFRPGNKKKKKRRGRGFFSPQRIMDRLSSLHDIHSWKEWVLLFVCAACVLSFTLYLTVTAAMKIGEKGIREKLNVIKPGDTYQHFKITFCQDLRSKSFAEVTVTPTCPEPDVTYIDKAGSTVIIPPVNLTSSLGTLGFLRCWHVDPWWVLPNKRDDSVVASLQFHVDWDKREFTIDSTFFNTCFNFYFVFYNSVRERNRILGDGVRRANARLLTRVPMFSRFYRLMPQTTVMPGGDVQFIPVAQEVASYPTPLGDQLCHISEYLYNVVPDLTPNMTHFKDSLDERKLNQSQLVCKDHSLARNSFLLSNADLETKIAGFEQYDIYTWSDFVKDLAFISNFSVFAFTRIFTTTISVPLHFFCGKHASMVRKSILDNAFE